MLEATIDISVILPTYNRSDILRRTLKLYGQQENMAGRYEVIVADDGSSDDTLEMLKSAQSVSKYPLQVVELKKNSGPSAARNRALSLAKGNILLFAGDDILPTPRLLAEHFEWHTQRYPERHIGVLGHVRWARELEITPLMHWLDRTGTQFGYGRMSHGDQVESGLLHTSNISLKASFLQDTGELFNERLRFYEDSEWALRLERRGCELRYSAQAIGDHLHPVDLDSSLARMRAVGRSLVLLKAISPENYDRVTHGLLDESGNFLKKTMLLMIDPRLGHSIYAPLSRACQKYFVIDRLFAACHASFLLGGFREELARSAAPTSEKRGPCN